MKWLPFLFLVLAVAGCAAPEENDLARAIRLGDQEAEFWLEHPLLLGAFAVSGPNWQQALEDIGVHADNFTVEPGFEEGVASSWLLRYESQVEEEVLLVHVGESVESEPQPHVDDGHDHGDEDMQGEIIPELLCPTSPNLPDDPWTILAHPDLPNGTGSQSFSYLPDGSCRQGKWAQRVGFHGSTTQYATWDGTDFTLITFQAPFLTLGNYEFLLQDQDGPLADTTEQWSINIPANNRLSVSYEVELSGLLNSQFRVTFEQNGQETTWIDVSQGNLASGSFLLEGVEGAGTLRTTLAATAPLSEAEGFVQISYQA